jgi:hypothetical protein
MTGTARVPRDASQEATGTGEGGGGEGGGDDESVTSTETSVLVTKPLRRWVRYAEVTYGIGNITYAV